MVDPLVAFSLVTTTTYGVGLAVGLYIGYKRRYMSPGDLVQYWFKVITVIVLVQLFFLTFL